MRRKLTHSVNSNNSRSARSESGIYLIELLVAVFISSLLAAALADNMAQTLKMTNGGQNQILAANMAQELIDNARNTDYSTLNSRIGTYTMLVNKTAVGQSGPVVDPRPLMLDTTTHDWTAEAERNKFNGSVTQAVANAGLGTYTDPVSGLVLPVALRITITVNWQEGRMNKNYTLQTLISGNGIHN